MLVPVAVLEELKRHTDRQTELRFIYLILPQKHGSLTLSIKVFRKIRVNRPPTP